MPTFERPIISTMANLQNDERKLTQLHCKEEIIKWLISVLLIDNNSSNQLSSSTSTSGISTGSNFTASTALDHHGSTSTIGTLSGYGESINGQNFARGSVVSNLSTSSTNENNSMYRNYIFF